MKTYLLLLIVLISLAGISCQDKTTESPENEVKVAFLSMYDFFNNEDLADSLVFNRFKSQYTDDFVFLGDNGSIPVEKESLLNSWEGMFKNLKPNFDITIDRLEVSGNLAYILYHYHEVFTNIETNETVIDVMHSAIMVLRKDEDNNWKCSVLKWT
jgi:ketosteroid isomerase-like protein